jgi:hypothetical protein
MELVVTGNYLTKDLSPLAIAEVADRLRQGPTIEIPVKHEFTPHLYMRTALVPAKTAFISKVHKFEHPFVMTKGKILVWTREGGVVCIEAPFSGITKPGTCRLVYAMEDTVWTTFHVTDETDILTLEKNLVWTPREFADLKYQEVLNVNG